MSLPQMIQNITPEQLTTLLQDAGYRVTRTDQGGVVQLLSASQGIGFAVRFGNPGSDAGSYLDYTFSCALNVQGELPADLVEQWNATRRFARLSRQGGFLVMEMDAIIAAGVSQDHLRSLSELWEHLLQEFIIYLREFGQKQAVDSSAKVENEPAGSRQAELDNTLTEA